VIVELLKLTSAEYLKLRFATVQIVLLSIRISLKASQLVIRAFNLHSIIIIKASYVFYLRRVQNTGVLCVMCSKTNCVLNCSVVACVSTVSESLR